MATAALAVARDAACPPLVTIKVPPAQAVCVGGQSIVLRARIGGRYADAVWCG